MESSRKQLDKLRLQCDLFLMSGEKKQALQIYDTLLGIAQDPFLYTAKAKLLESLHEEPQAIETFEKALRLAGDDEKERIEILRMILELENSASGILKVLASQKIPSQESQVAADEEKTELLQKIDLAGNEDWEKTQIEATQEGNLEKTKAPATQLQDVSPGERVPFKHFGRYNLLSKLGEGGMGTVYKACDIEIGRIVALKVILGNAPQYAQRFLQEIKATARLRHPNIVSIYDFGDSPHHYFTMEYVEGKTLSQWIHEGIFKPQKAAQVLEAIASAIECAHQSKIIHRDLKPSNVMMDEGGNIKVMDFGLAKIVGGGESNLSKTGDIVGTPSYMSPEQAIGKEVDERSDVYSIGAIGYEMITGRAVFKGESLFNILHQVSNKEPVRPKSINANVDIEIETIILKCLEKTPGKRYQSAKELREELQRYLGNRPILAKHPTAVARVVKWVKRNREVSLAILVAMLSLLGVFLYITYQWVRQVRHNYAANIIREVMQWDVNEVSYRDEVRLQFEKAEGYSRQDVVYRTWGLFCFQYAQARLHKAQQEHPEIKEEDLEERDVYYREAMSKFSKAFALNGCDYFSLYYMIFILYAWEENERAYAYEAMLSRIVKGIPEASGLKCQTLAVEMLNHSYSLPEKEKAKMQNQALELYRNAIRYDPKLPCSYNGLSIVHRERGEYELSLKYANKCIQLTPTYRYAYVNRARLYLKMGLKHQAQNDPQSMECFRKSQHDYETVVDFPYKGDVYYKQVTMKDVYYELAQVFALQGKGEETVHALKKAIQEGLTPERIKKEPAFSASLREIRKALDF